MKLRYQLILLAVMIILVPHHRELSSCRLTYMFGHAGYIHYMLNATSYIFLWRIASPGRLFVAWLCAVGCSFIPSALPVIGWSVVIYFLVGMTLAYRSKVAILNIIAPIAISLFIPGIAAAHHAAMLFLGVLWSKWEGVWQRTA